MKKEIYNLDRDELRDYLFNLQLEVKSQIKNYNNNVDKFLDNTNIFNDFEEILPDEEFGIFILTMLNNFKSDIIIDDLLDNIENAKNKFY